MTKPSRLDERRVAAQLPLDGLDPYELADLLAHERARLYDELGLDGCQRQAAEDAVRLVIADEYREPRG